MAQEPGGRIPRDNRPVAAKGVGKNAKRHDLERPSTPGLHGSDLQVGDVQALEQGQRVAPIKTQEPATQQPTGNPTRPLPANGGDPSELPPIEELIQERLGGTLVDEPASTPELARRADGWARFFTEISRNSQASSGMRTRAAQQVKDLNRLRRGPTSTIYDLDAAETNIDAFLTDNGY